VAQTASDKVAISLVDVAPTQAQRRFALVVIILQFVACAVVAPFPIVAPRIDGFVPVILAVIFVADLVTAVLLLHQAAIAASRALVVLANGYLFSALIVVPHALTFPGAFAPNGLLAAGIQSSGWLNVFWHAGFLAAVCCYVSLKDKDHRDTIRSSGLSLFGWSVAVQLTLVGALTWIVTAGDRLMPRLFLDDLSYAPLAPYAAGALVLLAVLAVLLVRMRPLSALDLWLLVALCMLISEMALVTVGLTARFYLGWYVSRALAMTVSTVVLIALLSQSIKVYAELALVNVRLERERTNRLMSIQAAISSLAHEIRRPLTVAVMNAAAAKTLLQRAPPDLGKISQLLAAVDRASFDANDIIENLRSLFADTSQKAEPIDVNTLALAALRILGGELSIHDVTPDLELAAGLPLIMGHKGQLQEVILNLVHNAIDAMDRIEADRRTLKIRTRALDAKAIAIEVEDVGEGIKPENLNRIFDAFVTTKAGGTGLGLAISRMIVERHGGRLTVQSDGRNGALFQIILPVEPLAAGASQSSAPLNA